MFSYFFILIQWFPTGVSRKISEKNYLGKSNFAVFVREIRRERKNVSSGGNFFFTISLEPKLRNHEQIFSEDLFIINQYNGYAAKI